MKIKVINNKIFQQQVDTVLRDLYCSIDIDFKIELALLEHSGYIIEKDEQKVMIRYHQAKDFFAAIGRLLIEPELTFVQSISTFKHLGLMLDAARNAVPKIETLKQWIRMLALLGYSYLEVYVEDVMEVLHEPIVGHMRGKYSIEEIRELDQYAISYGIELIPCIQTLAHLEGIFKHPEYKTIHDIDDILLVNEPKTYDWIEHLFETTKRAFSSNRINIGMDEAWQLGLGRFLTKNGYQNRLDIMLAHVEKVIFLCEKYHYNASMWADMFFHLAGGGYHQKEHHFDPSIQFKIPQNVQLIYWDYYQSQEENYHKKYHALKQITHNYAFAGGAWKWIGFAPHNRFSMQTLKPAILAAKKHHVNDFLVTAWGDNGAEASVFSIIPTMIYISCMNQQLKKPKDSMNRYSQLLTNYRFSELIDLDLPNLLRKHPTYHYSNPQKYLFYMDMLLGHRRIQIKKEDVVQYQKHMNRLKKLSKRNSIYAYMFETLAFLSKVLAAKIDLTLVIDEAYQNKQNEVLKQQLIKLKKLSKNINHFYEAFNQQWSRENKPFGFEIHTYRIGGLMLRVDSISKTISDYINGNIDKIDELDQPHHPIEIEQLVFNQFANIISYNKL